MSTDFQHRALLLALAASGCASHPKMEDGVLIEVSRGYAILPTTYHQRNHRVDSDHVKDTLAEREESASDIALGRTLHTFSTVALITGSTLLLVGGWGHRGLIEMEKDTAVGLMVSGLGFYGVNIGLRFGAEGAYVSGVEEYNEALRGLSDDEKLAE